jgi:putative oxidoreductase
VDGSVSVALFLLESPALDRLIHAKQLRQLEIRCSLRAVGDRIVRRQEERNAACRSRRSVDGAKHQGGNAMNEYTRYLPALGRLLIALLFVLAGFNKIMGPAATQAYITSAGLPLPLLAYIIAIVVEVGGGILLIVGFQTRIVALVLTVFVIATALTFHHNLADQAQFVNFFKNLSIAGGLLQVVAFGAGIFSIDGLRDAKGV